MSDKLVYFFSKDFCEGNAEMSNLLGRKGANLAEMCLIGLNVPPGFTLSTKTNDTYSQDEKLEQKVIEQTLEGLSLLEKSTNLTFGDKKKPLLLSVRSGSTVSMPGMMDTILNIGVNDQTFEGLADIGGTRFAIDTYSRLIKMHTSIVHGVESSIFDNIIESQKEEYSVQLTSELPEYAVAEILEKYKKIVKIHTGKPFCQDLKEQLLSAIACVFKSWNNERAITYRKINNIDESAGTAVNIQTMVFGNINKHSATGVAFSRNPSTGEKKVFGEFLPCAQGEDIVAGTSTPLALNGSANSMESILPHSYNEFENICLKLEKHYKDMQDIEFTIQNKQLWILQTRNAKRSINAAIKIAIDMEKEALISEKEAIERIDAKTISRVLHPVLSSKSKFNILCKGLPASPGAVSGKIALSFEDAERITNQGHDVILVRPETSPDDIKSMNLSAGIVTARGGMTSHAAVVARGMGKPCICGLTSIEINKQENFILIEGKIKINNGDYITINGTTGEMMLGIVETVPSTTDENFNQLMRWTTKYQKISVRANADTPDDSKVAMKFLCDGIGLCRTEHMFFNDSRIETVQKMIMSENTEERLSALAELQTMQMDDFKKIFSIMSGKPITIRLLDLPLHEFLPKTPEAIEKIAKKLGKSSRHAKTTLAKLTETNPMLGHRGCRLAMSYPEIYETQVHAIMSACTELAQEKKEISKPEIMVPLIMNKNEVIELKKLVERVASNYNIDYSFGAMIELPRAALTIEEFAQHLDFISFGTNDLTQTTLGISRDDSSIFLSKYKKMGIIQDDPFETLDKAVCLLVEQAIKTSKKVNPNIKIGLCGEHGGDIRSIKWCMENSIDYVSCSPYRIPIAKIVTAQ